ncbi:hypothetical protein PUY80_08420 [Plantibacter flavus]|uniref:hypothetical protein n=1 Tax=Plantibacter flavus TaxID=150123 RepID=UPI0023788F6B|nr:hypothetical protein [Plantibacter flavus]MDD9152598.1 hypothetical protein [Plantibacter flavus]
MTEWTYEGVSDGVPRRRQLTDIGVRCQALMGELAELWLRSARSAGWSVATATHGAIAVRAFVRIIDESDLNHHVSLYDQNDNLGPAFVEWRATMRGAGAGDKKWRYILALVRRAHYEGRSLQPTLQIISTQPLRAYPPVRTPRPLDEFSNAERLSQMRAATVSLQIAERRVASGTELYRSDPTLRRIVQLALSQPSFHVVESELRQHPSLVSSMEDILGHSMGERSARRGPIPAVTSLASLLGPTLMEVYNYQILIQWATGLPPEVVRRCTPAQLTFGGDGVRWRGEKARAQKLLDLTFEGEADWQVAGLLKRAIRTTEMARNLGQVERILTGVACGAGARNAIGVVSLRLKPTMSSWLEHHGIQASRPHDLRRIRKSYNAVRAGVAPNATLAAQPDHTMTTFERHYAGATTTKTRAGRIVVRAQERVVSHTVQSRAKIINAYASAVAEDPTVPSSLSVLAGDVQSRPAAERTLTASACSNPRASPFAEVGTWCHQAPFTCMVCPNAVIFNDHAPQLLLVKAALVAHRLSSTPDEFAEWGHPLLLAVEDYLNQLDPESVRKGSDAVASGTERLQVALMNRTTP